MLSAKIIRVLREDHAEANKNLFKVIVCAIDAGNCLMLTIISTTLLYQLHVSVILSIYAKLYSQSSTRCPRESDSTHASYCVYLSKIEKGSYHHKNLHHIPMLVHVNE